MPLAPKNLAAKLALNERTVRRLIDRGMPTTSVAAANRWREQNSNGQRIKKAAPDPTLPDADEKRILDLPDDLAELNRKAEAFIAEGSEEIGGILERARRIEKHAALAVETSGRGVAFRAADQKSLIGAHSVACVAALKAERDFQTMLESRGVLLTVEQAKAMFLPFLQRARAAVDALPATCGARCNPSDPVMSRQILQEWVENTFLRSVGVPPELAP